VAWLLGIATVALAFWYGYSSRPPTPDTTAPSAGDTREEATRAYEQALTLLARRADALDLDWPRFKSACYGGPIRGSFDREWYALYDPRALPGMVTPGCEGALADLRRLAEGIRAEMASQEEAARRAKARYVNSARQTPLMLSSQPVERPHRRRPAPLRRGLGDQPRQKPPAIEG
jgi:hypothetical protein